MSKKTKKVGKINKLNGVGLIFKGVGQKLGWRWLEVILLAVSFSIVVGITYAYFTSKALSADLVFHTGSLKMDLTDPTQLSFANLKPGDKQVIDFSVKNSGSLPIYLKGKFSGGWLEGSLDNTKLTPIKLEYQVAGSEWVTLMNNGPVLNEDFFYSHDNDSSHLIELASNQEIHWRATFQLAQDVNDSYQNQQYKTQIHFAAKQIDDESTWPSEY